MIPLIFGVIFVAGSLFALLVTMATLCVFALNCIVLYRDGKKGLRMMAGPPAPAPGTFKPGCAGQLPVVITSR